jgi:exonuclease VII small subunit
MAENKSVDKKIAELEALAKQLEGEKGFDKSVELFTKGAALIKELLAEVTEKRGQVYELIKQVDGIIETPVDLD